MQQYCPPAAFGIVEPKVYRTNSLYPVNFPFIKMLGLKTVVQLSPEVPIKAVTQFLEENHINFVGTCYSYYLNLRVHRFTLG